MSLGDETLAQAILSTPDWLTAEQVAHQLGLDSEKTDIRVNAWIKEGRLFSVTHHGEVLLPAYAFDNEGEPRPIINTLLTLFDGKKSPVALAAWFASINGWLSGVAPKQALALHPEQVLHAARQEVSPCAHG